MTLSEEFQTLAQLRFDPAMISDALAWRLVSQKRETLDQLTKRLDVERLEDFTASGRLYKKRGSLYLDGKLQARVRLMCGVSLEPYTQQINQDFATRFIEGGDLPPLQDDEELPEPLTDQGLADVGEFLVQVLSLALPDLPRNPTLAPLNLVFGDDDPQPEEKPNPFAILKGLKPRNENQEP